MKDEKVSKISLNGKKSATIYAESRKFRPNQSHVQENSCDLLGIKKPQLHCIFAHCTVRHERN